MAQLREGSVIKKPTGDEVIATVNDIPEIPTTLPASGGDADTVGGFTVGTNVPANAKFTDTIYTHPSTHSISEVANLQISLDSKSPTNHASSATTYGIASTSVYGHAKLSTSVSSTSTSLAATPSAVKQAYDLANSKTKIVKSATQPTGLSVGDVWIQTI